MTTREIHCCGCEAKTQARLTNGAEVYPHRRDLAALPFWKCDTCGNHVGCHHKSDNPTNPLGCIPTPELRKARSHIHALIDPVWKSGRIKRGALYRAIGERVGRPNYHTALIRSVEEAREVYRAARQIIVEMETTA